MSDNEGKQLTPYQGKRRVFGEFQCPTCYKRWQSKENNSWSNKGQECVRCQINVYPHKQRGLDVAAKLGDLGDLDKPHRQDLCQKRKEIGRNCRNH